MHKNIFNFAKMGLITLLIAAMLISPKMSRPAAAAPVQQESLAGCAVTVISGPVAGVLYPTCVITWETVKWTVIVTAVVVGTTHTVNVLMDPDSTQTVRIGGGTVRVSTPVAPAAVAAPHPPTPSGLTVEARADGTWWCRGGPRPSTYNQSGWRYSDCAAAGMEWPGGGGAVATSTATAQSQQAQPVAVPAPHPPATTLSTGSAASTTDLTVEARADGTWSCKGGPRPSAYTQAGWHNSDCAVAGMVWPGDSGLVMARDPGTIVIPPLAPGAQPAPDHIANHERSAYTAAAKTAGWNTCQNSWCQGRQPDWCGQRADGAITAFFRGLLVATTTGRGWSTDGISVMFSGGQSQSTVFYDNITWNGRPNSNNTRGDDFAPFDTIPCPPGPPLVAQ